MSEQEYHRHANGDVVRGPAVRCIDPAARATDVSVIEQPFNIHDALTCHEDVTRRGESQPCDKTATAFRYDEEGDVYPVCARHSRAPMVPLTLARFYLSTDRPRRHGLRCLTEPCANCEADR